MANVTQRYLALYAGLLTIVFAVVVLSGAAQTRVVKFEEIDVQRINIREPDGTLRMVISSMSRFPDQIEMDGEKRDHPRKNAGMLFFNDEGVENGGLVFAGRKDAEGKVTGFVHLSMDQYKQDQVIALNQVEDDERRTAGLTVFDRPQKSIMQSILEKEATGKMPQEGYAERLYVGKNSKRESVVELSDADNKVRMRLLVQAGGEAAIEFLDAKGRVQRRLVPEQPVAH
jgi:hypothetical protein